MLYNGIVGCHGVILINAFFPWYPILYMQVQSMCVTILRSIGTKLTNLENMPKSYVLFDVTSKVIAQAVVLMFLMTLTLDLCSIGCHTK